jgi:hypothetical protein
MPCIPKFATQLRVHRMTYEQGYKSLSVVVYYVLMPF